MPGLPRLSSQGAVHTGTVESLSLPTTLDSLGFIDSNHTRSAAILAAREDLSLLGWFDIEGCRSCPLVHRRYVPDFACRLNVGSGLARRKTFLFVAVSGMTGSNLILGGEHPANNAGDGAGAQRQRGLGAWYGGRSGGKRKDTRDVCRLLLKDSGQLLAGLF
jgi:hypothetical protein